MHRKIKAKELLALIAAGASLILLILLVISYIHNMNRVTIDRMLYQYYTGVRYEYSGEKILEYEEDKGVILNTEGNKEYLDTIPLYFDDEERIILTNDMVYTAPNSNMLFGNAGFFTEFYYNSYEQAVMYKSIEAENRSGRGFLYDGKDVYVFLEPVTVRYGGKKYELDTFSYIEAIYNYELRIFSYADTESYIFKTGTEPIYADAATGYRINLQDDILEWTDGRKVILFTEASILPRLGTD